MHLTIRDLGPHAETTIPLTGRVTIRVVEPTEPEPSDDAARAAWSADRMAWEEADRTYRRAESDLRVWRSRRDSIRIPDRLEAATPADRSTR